MSRYRMIALDMDGTMLTEEKTISAETRAAILAAEDAGIKVVFATGRGIQNALPYAVELGLTSPLVTVNGGEVWKAPGELLERHPMQADEVRRMHQLAIQYDTWYWAYSVGDVFNKETWDGVGDIDARTWLKFGYYTENLEVLGTIRQQLESWDLFEITNSHPCNIEMNPKGVNKASGLRRLCELYGFDMSQVIAMGDSLNDVSMIREAGLGVAMGNAQDEVKKLADTVTLTNEEHGVARIIREYALGGNAGI
ncbi:Cof-type HAD-IIB family hydrolase [Paenibacillus validus]|uniref:HAD-IIB family hydrolase n=1 Tax=Paenibacillus validus TaxID=44253 RepID=A0A7X2ZA05_9BACL|nr:Cof-type HAD-IIB family hydrolase [Paenibacillus validus]MUG71100.1 HAD-IIB family hydrolase [Paenibacillus validus]